jgi:hypothetical protein
VPFVKGQVANPSGRPRLVSIMHLSKKEKSREYQLKTSFGICLSEYNYLLEKQAGKCAICGEKESIIKNGKIQDLSVDHDHETGVVRGLLCYRCNTGIGKLRDDPELLRIAADYIETSSANIGIKQLVLVFDELDSK